ncbi:MAG TPA: hypothetical protein VGF65_11130 [Mycobacterium sp.]
MDTSETPGAAPLCEGIRRASRNSPEGTAAAMLTQIPPADELADVRARIKMLEEREVELRNLLIGDPSARTGNHYLVEVREVETKRTDLKELRAMYPDLVEEYTYPVKTTRVDLKGITEDGEIVSLRSKATKVEGTPQ